MYSVIHSVNGFHSWSIANVQSVSLLTNRDHKPFYLFELFVDGEIKIGPYTVYSHHISVYADHREGISEKSQYHYTGYMQNDSGEKYRLHVHFDANDCLVYKPLLAVSPDDGDDYESIENTVLNDQFQDLAQLYVRDWAIYIRKLQQDMFTKLTKEYELLNDQSAQLAQNLEENKIAYISALTQQIEKINEILRYVDDKVLERKRGYLSNLKKSMELHIEVPEYGVDREAQDAKEPEAELVIGVPNEHEGEPSRKLNVDVYAEQVRRKLQNLSVAFMELTLQSEMQIQAKIGGLFTNIKTLEFELEFCTLPFKDMHKLEALSAAVQKKGVSFINRILLSGQYEQASALSVFYPYLSKNITSLALMKNNGELFKFLLQAQIVMGNHKNFKVGEQSYHSLMDYCFSNTNEKNSKAAVFEVLLQHEPALLLSRDNNDLPYAAKLLLERGKHPLWSVFVKHGELTIANPQFVNRLNTILSGIKAQAGCSALLKKQITELLASNKERSSTAKMHQALGGKTLVRLANQTMNEASELFGDDFIKKLINEPEIKRKNLEIDKKIKLLLPKLTNQERIDIRKRFKVDYEAIRNNFKLMEVNLDVNLIFGPVKLSVLQKQDQILRVLALREELADVHTSLKRVSNSTGNLSKTQKKAGIRQAQIIHEMQSLGHQVPLSDNMNQLDSASDLIEKLSLLAQLAKKLSEMGFLPDKNKQGEDSSDFDPSCSSLV